MCGIVLLIALVLYAIRIPGLLRSTPAEFPGCDPALHARWRAKSLRTIYVFIGGICGLFLITFGAAMVVLLLSAKGQDAQDTAAAILGGGSMLATLIILIWALILERQSLKLKKALMAGVNLPPTYYPRPGQQLAPMPPAGGSPLAPDPSTIAEATDQNP